MPTGAIPQTSSFQNAGPPPPMNMPGRSSMSPSNFSQPVPPPPTLGATSQSPPMGPGKQTTVFPT